MEENKGDKIERVLGLYTKLMNGSLINKAEEANNYGVNERSIQRDIDDVRNFFELGSENTGLSNYVVYDRIAKGYRLDKINKPKMTNGEVLALCKILLDSRALVKQEMEELLEKLISSCVPKINQKLVKDLISNEMFHYVEPRHRTHFTDTMWEIGQAIRRLQYIEIEYSKLKDKAVVRRKVKPLAIMFSEYYFYLIAFIEDDNLKLYLKAMNDSFPTIYRMDRIKTMKVLDERFHIPYSNRFEEGEFRKRIQFMYAGKLQKVKFRYSGNDIDAVLDRIPTARIISEVDGIYTISAEVFGNGIDMWLRSQGDIVSVIE